MKLFSGLLLCATLAAADRPVDPTWLRRRVAEVEARPSDVTTSSCRYRPVFGAGDRQAALLRGIARFGEIEVGAGGACAKVNRPAEEQAWVVLEGGGSLDYAGQRQPLRKNDFLYIPPGVEHSVSGPARIVVMGFRMPAGEKAVLPPKLLIANIEEVKKEVVGGHPPTTLYQLLMGDTNSKRDRLAAARVLTSLFIMEFDAGGTNHPHHHDREEEIYLVLDGHGDMVAGGGMDGVEGRHPAKVGDAFFFRLNCTVGFYAGNRPGEPKARILAVRSLYPFRGR